MATRLGRARRPMRGAGAVDRPGVEPRPCYPERAVSRVRRRAPADRRDDPASAAVRATMRPMAGSALDRVRGLVAALAVARRPARWPLRLPPPTAPSRPSRRRAASLLLGWTFEPLPTLGIWRSSPAGGGGRSGGSTRSIRPTRCRVGGRVAFLAGMLALAFALLSGIERYDTTLFSVHMVQHVLLMLVAAPLSRSAAPITLLLRLSLTGDPPAAGSCRCSIRGSCGSWRSRSSAWLMFAGDDVGGPFLAAVQRVARGPAHPRPRARAVPDRRAPLLVAGGRARPGAVADGPPGPDRATCSRR